MKILVINGSARKDSNTRKLAQRAVDYLQEQIKEVQLFDLEHESLPILDGKPESFAHPNVKLLKTYAEDANGFFICTPEYHNAVSGALKNALDFLNRDYFTGKPVSIGAIAGGGKGGINALNNLRLIIRGVNGLVLPQQIVVDYKEFDEKAQLNKEAHSRLVSVLDELIYYVGAVAKK
ncbi:NADPH-dependent FMN reductase [Thermoflavimicrobium daqui]|jgi:azobenzene reductase|uniref:FMN-dependent NADH-azoreductase n=1 Tax=Thermoflavimicrobium daqui TaxID=2137476 RepID=A0A364K3X3_9BACL|nr:NADPH-dependent FMN reductase [Thermoflavimicrobium daqui]RAL24088.1 FMN-dependent NADH-azoreductase [Thermoflavimicrobium daqui]